MASTSSASAFSTATLAAALPPTPYTLPSDPLPEEDVLFCVDIDKESQYPTAILGSKGQLTRLDAIKQAMLLFVNTKHAASPHPRFSFATLAQSAHWSCDDRRDTILGDIYGIKASEECCGEADLTELFVEAKRQAIRSRARERSFRVILFYNRSSSKVHHDWPETEKYFTLDVMYLHDKPSPDNCPTEVFSSLQDTIKQVSKYEGYSYSYNTVTGTIEALCKEMCVLVCHPAQRCPQSKLDIPKDIGKKKKEPTPAATFVKRNNTKNEEAKREKPLPAATSARRKNEEAKKVEPLPEATSVRGKNTKNEEVKKVEPLLAETLVRVKNTKIEEAKKMGPLPAATSVRGKNTKNEEVKKVEPLLAATLVRGKNTKIEEAKKVGPLPAATSVRGKNTKNEEAKESLPAATSVRRRNTKNEEAK